MDLHLRIAGVIAIIGLTGCSSTPRGFAPLMTHPPADQVAFEAAFEVCGAEVASGRRDSFRAGRGGSAAGGLAIGATAGLAAGASAASGAGMLAGVAGAAGLAAGLVVFAPLGFYGMSRVQRASKEREIKTAMTACLSEEGYVVEDWRVPRQGATGPTSPTRPAPAPG